VAREAKLLSLDPDLAEGLDAHREQQARDGLLVRVERLPSGIWAPKADEFGAMGGLGLVVTHGLAARRVSLGRRSAAELLGPGDLLRPWEDDGEHAAYPFSFSMRVLDPLAVAVLDARTTRRLMYFPEIVSRLMGRVMARSRRVVGHLVIAQIPSVDQRLWVAMWHLSDRFGRVTPDGVLLPLRLTHETLGLIVGARRPSVTSALGRLVERGHMEPREDHGWLLKGESPDMLSQAPRLE
jgi:CRP/FNR family transcriptional regulator, cyclic AMP receptor protein